MAQGVTVVEDQAGARVAFVLGDRVRFHPDASGDEGLEGIGLTREHRGGIGLQLVEQRRSSVSPYFATSASPERKSRSGRVARVDDVGEHGARLRERPHQVLAFGQVHGGLATDRGIHLRRERRRHLHEGHAPHVGRGDEPRQVADRSATQGHHEVVPMRLLGRQLVQQDTVDVERLRLLAGRHGEQRARPPAIGQPGGQPIEPPVGHVAIGHDEGALGLRELRKVRGRLVDHALARRPRRRHAREPGRSRGPTKLLDDRVGDLTGFPAAVHHVGGELPIERAARLQQALEVAVLADQRDGRRRAARARAAGRSARRGRPPCPCCAA